MNKDLLIHIVIPLYNEEYVLANSVETIVDFLSEQKFPYRYEIILANNASTDRTAIVAQEIGLRFPQVRLLDLRQKGKGRAIRSAWSESPADVLAFMDVDLASDLAFFRELIDGIVIGKNDMTIGSRLGPRSKIIGRRGHREVMSRIYNQLIRFLFKTGVPDHQCGFKAISKEAYSIISPYLEDNGWFLDTELIVWSRKQDLKILPIDIIWTDRTGSKVSIPKTSLELLKSAFKLKKRIGKIG